MASTIRQRLHRFNGTDYDTIHLETEKAAITDFDHTHAYSDLTGLPRLLYTNTNDQEAYITCRMHSNTTRSASLVLISQNGANSSVYALTTHNNTATYEWSLLAGSAVTIYPIFHPVGVDYCLFLFYARFNNWSEICIISNKIWSFELTDTKPSYEPTTA